MNKKLLDIIKRDYDDCTQREIAERVNMKESDVSLIWTGKRKLTVETLCKLCAGLNVEPWEIWKEACDAQ